MLSPADWQALWLTLRLAALVTVLLLLLGTPLAWWLARSRSFWRRPVAAVVALPLVLPPTVLGFYLLLAMGPSGPVGRLTEGLGLGLLPFTFPGLVVASMLYSLPFVVQPLQAAFQSLEGRFSTRITALAEAVRESGGTVRRLGNDIDVPSILPVRSTADASGRDFMGFRTSAETELRGVGRQALFGGFLGLGLMILVIASMWYREGR